LAALGVGARSGCFFNAGTFVYTTRAGKFAVWAELLDRLELKETSGCSTSAAAAVRCC